MTMEKASEASQSYDVLEQRCRRHHLESSLTEREY